MASDRPAWAQNLPSQGTYYYKFWDFATSADLADFVPTIVTDGAGWDGSIAITDARGGVLACTNTTTDDDEIQMDTEWETIRFNKLGFTYYIYGRFKIDDATQLDLVFGVHKRDTTWITLTSDGIFFAKDDGSTDIKGKSAFNASATSEYGSTTGASTADTSYHDFEIRVVTDANTLGAGVISFYVDGTLVGQLGSNQSATSICHDEEMTIGWAHRNGEAAAKTFSIDKLGVLAAPTGTT